MSDWFDPRGITTGLTIAAVLWLAGFLRSRWGLRKRRAQAEYERRIPLRVGAGIVAAELRDCAELIERWERGDAYLVEVAGKIPTIEWPRRQTDMAELRNEDPDLWKHLDHAYTSLGRTKRENTPPPSAKALRDLAARVDRVVK